jgi:hypothetical protein
MGGKGVTGFDVITEASLPAQKGIVFDPAVPGIVAGSRLLGHAMLRINLKACGR